MMIVVEIDWRVDIKNPKKFFKYLEKKQITLLTLSKVKYNHIKYDICEIKSSHSSHGSRDISKMIKKFF